MPFDSPDHAWVIERFSGHDLAQWAQWLAGWMAGVVERAEPAIRSDFDVYYEDGGLLYAGGEWGSAVKLPGQGRYPVPDCRNDALSWARRRRCSCRVPCRRGSAT